MPDGGFVIVWENYGQDGDEYGIYARLYTSNAVAATPEFQVNQYTTAAQRWPAVAVDGTGRLRRGRAGGQGCFPAPGHEVVHFRQLGGPYTGLPVRRVRLPTDRIAGCGTLAGGVPVGHWIASTAILITAFFTRPGLPPH